MSAVALADDITESDQDAQSSSSVIGNPLPEFDTIGATAYEHRQDRNLYILVQNRNVPLRKNILDAYNRIKASALSDLRESKVLDTPHGQAACFFMQRPRGGRLFNGKPIGDKVLRSLVLPSVLGAMRTLHEEGATYRFLSPDRIYYKSETAEELVLLECFSVPAGLQQLFSYETIGRSMVDPVARGEGVESDDYYALGILIAHLMLGRDPIGARSEQSFQQARMSQGSFAAVVSGSSITGAVSALLRGLLQDDPEQRWGHKDVMNWINGELRSASPGSGNWVMAQTINFQGRTITDSRALSAALQANPDAAYSLFNRQAISQWVLQIAPGNDAHQALVNLLEFGSTTKRVDATATTQDAVLARFCSLLDPHGPVRYRDISLMPDALGPFFASAHMQGKKEHIKNLQSLMSGNIWHALMDIRTLLVGEESQIDQMDSRMAWLKDARQINDSMEQALYTLNEGLPCHSPEVAGAWVSTPMQAMRALDKRCLTSVEGIKLDDVDLLAFFAARASSVRPFVLKLANLPVEKRDTVHLKMFGEMHQIYGSRPLKGLARLFQIRFRSRIAKLKSKTRRELLTKKVKETSENGDIFGLSKLVNIERLQAADERGFSQARAKVKKLERAMLFASRIISPNDPTAIAKSAQVTSYLGAFVLLGSLMMRLL